MKRQWLVISTLLATFFGVTPRVGSPKEQVFRVNNTAEVESLDPAVVTGVQRPASMARRMSST